MLFQSVLFQLLRKQMPFRNLYLLLCDISAYLNNLHPVKQWSWNGAYVVGGGYEQHFGKVVVNVQIVVVECVVLFRVKYFKQCRCRITVDSVLGNLVYLVKNEHRVRRACFEETAYDSSRHGTDVCSPVSSYL